MRRCHSRAVQTLAARCGAAAQPITAAVDARHFRAGKIAHDNQERRRKGQFQRAVDLKVK
jgi:hypothetical protein